MISWGKIKDRYDEALRSAKQSAPNWVALRRLGGHRLLKSSYFWLFAVPVLAKFLAYAPDKIRVPVFGNEIDLNLHLPFSWKVFFVMAICFSLGEMLYSWRCPPLIRDYKTLDEFKSSGKTALQILWAYGLHLETCKFDGRDIEEHVRKFQSRYGHQEKLIPSVPTLDSDNLTDRGFGNAFHGAISLMEDDFPNSRLVCALFFGAGFALAGLIAVQNIYFVFVKDIFSVGN